MQGKPLYVGERTSKSSKCVKGRVGVVPVSQITQCLPVKQRVQSYILQVRTERSSRVQRFEQGSTVS